MSKYRTGFCAQGWCEGTKPKTFRGDPAPSCKFTSAECACKCHKQLDEMFEIAGLERVIQDVSEYVPDHSRFVMPDRLALAAERAERIRASRSAPSPDAVVIAGRAFEPTPTGQRGRGQLEYAVLEELNNWIDKTYELVPVTPVLLSEVMGKKNPPAPSSGAIHAVFQRWVKLGFAKFQNRPAQFLGFVGSSSVDELDKLKHATKRDEINRRRMVPK